MRSYTRYTQTQTNNNNNNKKKKKQPPRSTQLSTLHGMVKWVSAFRLSSNKWWW